MNTLSKIDKEIITLYAMITVGAILMLIPYGMLPFAGFACAFVGFVSAYVYKWRYKNNADIRFHMGHIIRTTWWSSLILTVGVMIFGCIVYFNGDISAINQVMQSAERGIVPSDGDIQRMQLQFVKDNMTLILVGAAVALLPYPVYLITKMVQGVRKIFQ